MSVLSILYEYINLYYEISADVALKINSLNGVSEKCHFI